MRFMQHKKPIAVVHFSCTFCDWGSAVFQKVRKFSDERVIAEYQWFADNEIDLLYNADANFAMFDRDLLLTEKLVETKQKYGYPRKFRAAYAKNSGDRVFKVSKLLNDAGMSKGTTLSFQSMDSNTLDVIKRKNIRMDNFRELMHKYRAENIPTYSELIIGLPGETYDSFATGIEQLLNAGAHSAIQVYTCELLPNSEMSEPAYREKYGIKSVKTPVLFFHGTPYDDPHQEFYDLVIGTNTLNKEDWLKCQMFAWVIQGYHCLPLLQHIAVFLHSWKGISYRHFYETLLSHALYNPHTVIGRSYMTAYRAFSDLREGKKWGYYDRQFGDIVWPQEEGAFLTGVTSNSFYRELVHFFRKFFDRNEFSLLSDVVIYQSLVTKSPLVKAQETWFDWNLPEYVQDCLLDRLDRMLERKYGRYEVLVDKEYDNLEEYAREVVWFGRKGGDFCNRLIPVEGFPNG